MAKNGFRIMDSDMHVMEPADLYEKFMEPQYLAWSPKLTPLPEKFGGSYTLMVDWQFKPRRARYAEDRERLMGSTRRMRDATASMREQGYNAPSQLEAMDIEGIDVAVLFPTVCLNLPNSYDNVDGSIAAALCRAYNNWLYEFCQTDPERLKLCAIIPAHEVKEAIKEAERAVSQLGAVGVFMHPHVLNERPWHSRYFDPLWGTLEEMDIPVCWHPEADEYLLDADFGNSKLMRHAYANPSEVMRTMMSMICGGIFEHFPGLKAAFLEANCGWAPFWVSRMEREYKNFGPWDAPWLKSSIREYYQRNCWVSVEADEEEAKFVVEALGGHNIVFSTDYPHFDSEFPKSVENFLEQPLSEDAIRSILWDNCARLYNLS
jgi:predicted TIM-barrel fold metal-dependent hydrolase